MKMFIKTVCITLCVSVTMLFFSSYKKTEAVAVTAVSAAAVAIGSIIVAVATYFAIDNLPDIQSYVNSSSFESSITTDDEGIAVFNPSSGLPAIINPNIFNAISEESVKAHNKYLYLHTSSLGGEHGGGGNHRIPLSLYEAAVTAAIAGIIASEVLSDSSSEDNAGSIPSGSASGLVMGITTSNGTPQKVTTSYMQTQVDVFDYLDFDYVTFDTILDINGVYSTTDKSLYNKYIIPFFIMNNTLYVPVLCKDESVISSVGGSQYFLFDYVSSYKYYRISGFSTNNSIGTLSYQCETPSYMSFKFAEVDNRLCVATYYYNYSGSFPFQSQFIYGYSGYNPVSYPVLFNKPVHNYSGNLTTNFQNYSISNTLYFVNPADSNDYFLGDVAISLDVECAGYILSTSSSSFNLSGNIGTAAKMLSGTTGSVQGGMQTYYSDLSDIEKAIYAMAQQQGITYEEMLEQCNILINENGEMYLESLDGVTQSIDSLLAEFDKLLEQGDITNENIAASTEQLKAILEYLKGLNIEGLGSYIQQLETTLDSLKQGDEDREALLGDVLDQLQGLNDYLDSLGVGAAVNDISQIKESSQAVADTMTAILNHEKDIEEKEQKAALAIGSLLDPTIGNYNLYDQCKYLLDRLFNYDDINIPPDFAFFWDSDGDGISERYDPFNLSFLETTLTNETFADKTWFFNEIKIIDFIRYLIAFVIYSFFVMRLIKRLPSFYGLGPLSRFGG